MGSGRSPLFPRRYLVSNAAVATDRAMLADLPAEQVVATVETVTPWLAAQALANQKQGACIQWLTPAKTALRHCRIPQARHHFAA